MASVRRPSKLGLGSARVGVDGIRAGGFTNQDIDNENEHAKPRIIQPRGSENLKRSTRDKDGRQKYALRRRNNCSALEARLNARAGTSLSIALRLPCPLSRVSVKNMSKLDTGTSLSVSGASRCHFYYVPRRSKVRLGRQIRSEKDILFQSARNREFVRDANTGT